MDGEAEHKAITNCDEVQDYLAYPEGATKAGKGQRSSNSWMVSEDRTAETGR